MSYFCFQSYYCEKWLHKKPCIFKSPIPITCKHYVDISKSHLTWKPRALLTLHGCVMMVRWPFSTLFALLCVYVCEIDDVCVGHAPMHTHHMCDSVGTPCRSELTQPDNKIQYQLHKGVHVGFANYQGFLGGMVLWFSQTYANLSTPLCNWYCR